MGAVFCLQKMALVLVCERFKIKRGGAVSVWTIILIAAMGIIALLIVLELCRSVLFPGLLQWERDLMIYGRKNILCIHYLDASGERQECKLAEFRLRNVKGRPGRRYWYATVEYQEFPGKQIWMFKHVLYCDGKPQWCSVINGQKTMIDLEGRHAPYHDSCIGGFHRLAHFLRIAVAYRSMREFESSKT